MPSNPTSMIENMDPGKTVDPDAIVENNMEKTFVYYSMIIIKHEIRAFLLRTLKGRISEDNVIKIFDSINESELLHLIDKDKEMKKAFKNKDYVYICETFINVVYQYYYNILDNVNEGDDNLSSSIMDGFYEIINNHITKVNKIIQLIVIIILSEYTNITEYSLIDLYSRKGIYENVKSKLEENTSIFENMDIEYDLDSREKIMNNYDMLYFAYLIPLLFKSESDKTEGLKYYPFIASFYLKSIFNFNMNIVGDRYILFKSIKELYHTVKNKFNNMQQLFIVNSILNFDEIDKRLGPNFIWDIQVKSKSHSTDLFNNNNEKFTKEIIKNVISFRKKFLKIIIDKVRNIHSGKIEYNVFKVFDEKFGFYKKEICKLLDDAHKFSKIG